MLPLADLIVLASPTRASPSFRSSFRFMRIYGTRARVRRLLDITRGLFVCVMRNGDRLVASVCTPYGASQATNHGLFSAANEIPFYVGFLFSICAPAPPFAAGGEKLEQNFRRRSLLIIEGSLRGCLVQPYDASEVSITKSRQRFTRIQVGKFDVGKIERTLLILRRCIIEL